LLWFRLGRWRP